jgi:glycosyltransferase involved in cell wall biosynthesis
VVTLEQNRRYFEHAGNVVFHAGISDIALRDLYHQASLSVLALTNTAANNALLESMACGLPIIATDLPAIREYTVAEGCGYVPPANPRLLAEYIALALRDRTRLEAMSSANWQRVQQYAWETIAARTKEVYDKMTSA